jgi:2-polyprenyl-3-methyl-5-hydroxy-6-metoxy-1,4-benzoquinol methylase
MSEYTDELKKIGKGLGYRGESIYIRYEKVSEIVNSLYPPEIKDKTLLHAGCGFGLLDYYLSTRFSVHGVDISKKEISEAIKLAKRFRKNFVYEVKDILGYTPKTKFDVVLCSEVIEHIPVPEKKIMEVLKSFVTDDGFIVITVPNRDQLRNRVRRFFGLSEVLIDKTHVKEYNHKGIEKIIKDNGLIIEKKDTAVLYFPLENLMRFIIPPKSFIRSFLIRIFPKISSHLIYVCKIKTPIVTSW